MPRGYVQLVRAQTTARTRAEILEAARNALLGSDRLEFKVGDIATNAGVARSTIYAIFGSRAGLLATLADDALHSGGLEDVLTAFAQPDAIAALEGSLRASCRMYGSGHRLFRRLLALSEVDPDAAAPIARSEADRAAGMTVLAARLAEQGRLRDGLSIERAADALSLVTSFLAFDELFSRRRLDVDAATELLLGIARRAVLAPAHWGTTRG